MLKGLTIGKLDRRLRIESATSTLDSESNHPVKTWSTLATVWAQRLRSTGRERYESKEQVSVSNADYKIRYRDDVTETMRVVEDSQIFYITSVQRFKREGYVLLTVEGRDNG
jgi:SPP1 family predicted phage head-tail adaptor